jgi:hypothetical protein
MLNRDQPRRRAAIPLPLDLGKLPKPMDQESSDVGCHLHDVDALDGRSDLRPHHVITAYFGCVGNRNRLLNNICGPVRGLDRFRPRGGFRTDTLDEPRTPAV